MAKKHFESPKDRTGTNPYASGTTEHAKAVTTKRSGATASRNDVKK